MSCCQKHVIKTNEVNAGGSLVVDSGTILSSPQTLKLKVINKTRRLSVSAKRFARFFVSCAPPIAANNTNAERWVSNNFPRTASTPVSRTNSSF